MELLFVVDTTQLLVAAPPFLNKQPVASQPASQPREALVRLGVSQRYVGSGAGKAGRRDSGSGMEEESILGVVFDAGAAEETGGASRRAG